MSTQFDLSEFLNEELPKIDADFSENSLHLNRRPYHAACLFVEEYIVEIEGDDKENYQQKSWFKKIYQMIREWYADRYGEALYAENRTSKVILSIVMIYDTPFELNIPKYIRGDSDENEKFWISTPYEVLPDEEVLNWVQEPPNFEQMDERLLGEVTESICHKSTHLRTIRMRCINATFVNDSMEDLLESVPIHIEYSAGNILSEDPIQLGQAYWDIQMATEKVLKSLIYQFDTEPPHTHNLKTLLDALINVHEIHIESSFVDNFPGHREIINLRYSRNNDLIEVVSQFDEAIIFIYECVHLIDQRINLEKAKFHLQLPPWME